MACLSAHRWGRRQDKTDDHSHVQAEVKLAPLLTRSMRLLLLCSLALLVACRAEPEAEPPTRPASDDSTLRDPKAASPESSDDLAAARRQFQVGDLEGASRVISRVLIREPENDAAKLLAGEIEAANGNHARAIELLNSIPSDSRLGPRAMELRCQSLLQAGQTGQAADTLLLALESSPQRSDWRHLAWRILSRIGRREEASLQADRLCQNGEANRDELLSLLRRNDSYPFALHEGESPSRYFEAGLGLAKWHFTQRDYRRALAELGKPNETGDKTPAHVAFYGRLLAETQSLEDLPQWIATCSQEVSRFSDYWAALGIYFFDQHQYEASTRALMETLLRDPTDDLSAHRLAKALDALGRHDDAEQARHRGVLIVQLEQDAQTLSESANDPDARMELPQKLLELGRPFESLAWTELLLPQSALQARAAVGQQRMQLSRNAQALRMAFEMSQMEINRTQFPIDAALQAIREQSEPEQSRRVSEVAIFADPKLRNVAESVGLTFQWYSGPENNLASIPLHEVMGGGIAVIDYDLDGWPDVYLAQGSGDPPTEACTRSNQLFRNLAGVFAAITEPAQSNDFHYSSGLASGDVNQDGFPDLLLGSLGRNRLLINNGDGTFHDATPTMGAASDRFTSSVAIADINGDHLPDLFEATYVEMEGGFRLPDVGPDGREIPPSPRAFYAQADRWFENRGDGSFRPQEVGQEIALPGSGLGVMITDFDSDGSNEIFVANDGRPNHFLEPIGNNQLQNSADAKGLAAGFTGETYACMGIAAGDFDRNGTADLHVTNFSGESANHYLQKESFAFTDAAMRFQIDRWTVPYIGFGVKSLDIDRNGWLDLMVTNGHIFDQRHLGEAFRMPAQLLINRGNRFEQADVQDDSGYWQEKHLGRSLAMCDFDRDGSIDFLVGHLDQPLALLRNETETEGHWIQLELVGTSSERDAIGTHLVVTCGEQQWHAWVTAGDGYLCTDEPLIDLGLGDRSNIDQLQVTWPSGQQQTFHSLNCDRRYLVTEGASELFWRGEEAKTR